MEQANAERGGGGSAARAGASDAGLEVNSSFLVVKKVQSVNLQCRSQKCVGCSGVHMRPDGSRAILFNGVAVFYVTGYDKIVTSAEQSINRRSCAHNADSWAASWMRKRSFRCLRASMSKRKARARSLSLAAEWMMTGINVAFVRAHE